jgi:hypothetical protein
MGQKQINPSLLTPSVEAKYYPQVHQKVIDYHEQKSASVISDNSNKSGSSKSGSYKSGNLDFLLLLLYFLKFN